MYHKMPLLENNMKEQTLKKIHNQPMLLCIFKYFHLLFQCFYRFFEQFHCQRTHSSKQMMKRRKKGASYDTYPLRPGQIRANGSMTLEMVVVLPLFVSFMVFFLFLFRILLVQECMEETLVYTARTLAVTCFAESPEEQKTQAVLFAEAQLVFRKGLKESGCPSDLIQGGAAGISLLSSEFTGDDIILRAAYEIRLPCVLLGSYRFHFVQCAQSRKWIGNQSLEKNDHLDEQWVYITPHGAAYHCSRTCSYLDLSIHAIRRQTLYIQRNAQGEIYHKCEKCGVSGTDMVYVTDYGTRYHGSLACSGLKRTIYMVKRSQVGGRKECSKCGIRQS